VSETLALWSTIVGFLLPPVMAVVMQARWRPELKGVVVFLACLVAATGTVSLQGQIGDVTALMTSILLIFAGVITTYRLYWRPSGIAPLVERRTPLSERRRIRGGAQL
jgi:hypothetical protein